MFQHQHQQQPQAPWSEIERFRARSRMRMRPTLVTASGTGAADDGMETEDWDSCERRRKGAARFERRQEELQQQLHPQFHQQQQNLPTPTQTLTAFHSGYVTPQEAVLVFPHMTDKLAHASPVPHKTHTLFNAFDSNTSPELFDCGDGEYQASCHEVDEPEGMAVESDHSLNHDRAERSIWRRRFPEQQQQYHQRKSPKLGQMALWDAPTDCDQPTLQLPGLFGMQTQQPTVFHAINPWSSSMFNAKFQNSPECGGPMES